MASETDAAPAIRDRLRDLLSRLGLPDGTAPFLETMLAVESEASRATVTALPGDTVVQSVARAVIEVLRATLHPAGQKHPMVMVLEDLHWSDSATLELVAQVAALTMSDPLLLVCVLRPDRKAQSWGLLERLQTSLGISCARIDLEPLDGNASRTLLSNLLQIEELPENIRGQILARSEGNPFYLEEVLRALIDEGQVIAQDGHWRATRAILGAKIPDTLAGVLSARIDRLPETTKRVAQTAAVIGRVFGHRVLERVCHEGPIGEQVDPIEPHIAVLNYEQLVRERAREPEREYAFKHTLTCEAAYGLLLKSRRRELHARTGAAIETLYADRRGELAGILAYHFSEADDPRALDYARQAAANARRLYALNEELMHRERIIRALESLAEARPGETIDALIEWTRVRHRLNDYAGVVERLEQAVALARTGDDRARLGTALSWLANTHFVMGFPSRATSYLVESQAIGRALGNEQMVLLPLFFGTWAVVDRDPAAAVGQIQEVIELARKNGVTDVLGHAIAYRAVAFARVGDFAAARAQIKEALDLLPMTPSPVKRADIHIAVGMALHDMGAFEESLTHARLGAEIAETARGMECACAGYLGVGRVQLERNEMADAHDKFERSLKYADIAGFEQFRNVIRGGAAFAEFELGSETAIEPLRAAVANAQASNDGYAAATLSEKLSAALLSLGRREEAGEAIGAALDYYRTAGMRPFLANALGVAGRVYDASGRPERAAAARSEAAAIAANLGARAAGGPPMAGA